MTIDLNGESQTANTVLSLAMDCLELIPFGVVIADHDSNIIQVNQTTEDMFDYHRSELIGQRVDVLMPEARRAVHRIHWEHFRRDPRPRFMGVGMKLPGRRKNGSEFPVEIQLASRRKPNGWYAFAFIRSLESGPPRTKETSPPDDAA